MEKKKSNKRTDCAVFDMEWFCVLRYWCVLLLNLLAVEFALNRLCVFTVFFFSTGWVHQHHATNTTTSSHTLFLSLSIYLSLSFATEIGIFRNRRILNTSTYNNWEFGKEWKLVEWAKRKEQHTHTHASIALCWPLFLFGRDKVGKRIMHWQSMERSRAKESPSILAYIAAT